MPSSGSITSPVPETINECSLSAMASSASSRRSARSIRQSLASSTAALVRLPRYSSSLPSNFSNSVKASAVAPANPATTLSLYIRRSFFAFCFMIVVPWVTWPSEPMATWPFRLTQRMVVERMTMELLYLILGARVRLVVGLHQPVQRHVRVLLGGGERRVAQHFLDRAQVRAAVQQMRGERMAQRVRRHGGKILEGPALLRDDALHAAGRQPAAATVADQRCLARITPRVFQIRPHRLHRLVAQQDDPLLAALAHHGGGACLQVHILDIQTHQLGDPDARRIEDFQDRLVTGRPWPGSLGVLH